MSGGDGAPPGKGPKQLSSRLMTMKFMQRAAASPTEASASASSGATGPNPKRLKNNSSQPSTPPNGPSTGTRTPAYPEAAPVESSSRSGKGGDIDWRRAAHEAARAEEERRQAALERAGTHGNETRWVLRAENDENNGVKPKEQTGLRILRYGEVDVDENAETEGVGEDQPWRAEGAGTGRIRYGGFKRKGEVKPPAKDTSDDDGTGADSESDASHSSKSSSNEVPEKYLTPRQSKAAQSSVQTPTRGRGGGISSGGGSSGRPSDGGAKCFRCGQTGHIKSQCPMNQGAVGGVKRARN